MSEYKDKIDELEKEYQEKRKELVEIQKRIIEKVDKYHEESDEYEKIECPKCNGTGRYRNKNKELKKCDNCINSRGFIYAKKFKGD